MFKLFALFCFLPLSLVSNVAAQSNVISENTKVLAEFVKSESLTVFPLAMAVITGPPNKEQFVMLVNGEKSIFWYSAPATDLKSEGAKGFKIELNPRRLYDLQNYTDFFGDVCEFKDGKCLGGKRVFFYRLIRNNRKQHFIGAVVPPVASDKYSDRASKPTKIIAYSMSTFQKTGEEFEWLPLVTPFYNRMTATNEFQYVALGQDTVWWVRMNFVNKTLPVGYNKFDDLVIGETFRFFFVFDNRNSIAVYEHKEKSKKGLKIMELRKLKNPNNTIHGVTVMINETSPTLSERLIWAAVENKGSVKLLFDKIFSVNDKIDQSAALEPLEEIDVYVNGKIEEPGDSSKGSAAFTYVFVAIFFALVGFALYIAQRKYGLFSRIKQQLSEKATKQGSILSKKSNEAGKTDKMKSTIKSSAPTTSTMKSTTPTMNTTNAPTASTTNAPTASTTNAPTAPSVATVGSKYKPISKQ